MNSKQLAPIILFAYNRPVHLKKTLDALAANYLAKQSELIIYIDGVKQEASQKDIQQTSQVKKIAEEEVRFKNKKVVIAQHNKGLAKSIIEGVTNTVNDYKKVIVLEDDMITSPYFLNFLNEALTLYENNAFVSCISGYIYPVKGLLPETFFIKGADCWGWATWKRAWDIFEPNGTLLLNNLTEKNLFYDFNFYDSYPYLKMLEDQIAGRNNSWAIRWYASAFLQEKLTLYPAVSFVRNIGFDGSGTHSGKRNFWEAKELTGSFNLKEINAVEDAKAKMIIADYFRSILKKSLGHHIKQAIRSIINKSSS